MKKILPIVAVLGLSSLVVGFSSNPTKNEKKESFINQINSFKNDVFEFTNIDTSMLTSTALNKYVLSLESENLNTLTNNTLQANSETLENNIITDPIETDKLTSNETSNQIENKDELGQDKTINNINEENKEKTSEIAPKIIETDNLSVTDENTQKTTENNQISTLYNLSNDIENSCDAFCELKEEINKAILETQTLINKVNQNEIELTNEQKMFISEQAQELKRLGRQLCKSTTELSFSLNDISKIIKTNSNDLDSLSLKYLVVLDNLVNGNEMLESGLTSLNLINQMFNMQTKNLPNSNNAGRILYGFQENNNPPVIKDYSITKDGDIIENKVENGENVNNTQNEKETNPNSETSSTDKKTNIDSYVNNTHSNIDTYNNTNLPQNIDTFFNTALLDNEFMYGNRGYGYGYGNFGQNPYMYGYGNPNNNNTTNGTNNYNNTQNTDLNQQENMTKNIDKRTKKKLQLKKNIDTYKDENEPSIKEKLGHIQNSVNSFFSKFKKSSLDDKVENPIYRFSALNNEELDS